MTYRHRHKGWHGKLGTLLLAGIVSGTSLVLTANQGSVRAEVTRNHRLQSLTSQARTLTIKPLREPRPPVLTPLTVTPTALTPATIAKDEADLKNLLSTHGGDHIVRGPDGLVYNVDVRIDEKTHEFAMHLQVHFHNNLSSPIHTLYFNVWPDAPHYRRAGGYQKILNMAIDGEPQAFAVHGTVLSAKLNKAVAAGTDATVTMNILSKLPKINDRYGYEGTTLNFGNWFPLLAVHDQYGWVTPPYYTDGESFYSLTGVFHVNVTAPSNLTLAISGDQTEPASRTGNLVTYHYRATGVRDIAMVGDTTFKVLQQKVGKTTVLTYYAPAEKSFAKSMEQTGVQSVQFFSKKYGTYPYKTLRICAMRGWFGGMEYPQLVMISFQQAGNTTTDINVDVAHEVAHQWFFGMVGDDEYLTPWIDEAFATFSEGWFHGTNGTFAMPVTNDHVSYAVSAFPSSDFGGGDSWNYYTAVYTKGAKTLYLLQQMLGPVKFERLMRQYFHQYQYQVATTNDFIQAANTVAGKDLTGWFRAHGVVAGDDLHSPILTWAKLEMQENQVSWHTP